MNSALTHITPVSQYSLNKVQGIEEKHITDLWNTVDKLHEMFHELESLMKGFHVVIKEQNDKIEKLYEDLRTFKQLFDSRLEHALMDNAKTRKMDGSKNPKGK